MTNRLDLFPPGARVDPEGHLWLGGCRASALAEEFGTPLYVFDEGTLRARCRAYFRALTHHYPGPSQLAYAAKAYLNTALAQLFAQEGLSLDVVSGGEFYVARRAGFPSQRIHFHGNNKSRSELIMALDAGVGRVVVDNDHELEMLEQLASQRGGRHLIWLRLSPGVDVHTHEYRKTGILDSKFGFPIATGAAQRVLIRALESPHLEPVGLHAHIGSQVLDTEPFALAATRLVEFAAAMRAEYGFKLRELSPGGGWGIAHTESDPSTDMEPYVEAVCRSVVEGCCDHRLPLPRLILEPGRSLVGPAGVALYRAGARKEIPGLRTYVSVDGGLADNIRPALYGARYTALVDGKADRPAEETMTIAGKFCESGDLLIRDLDLPRVKAGDLLLVPAAGAYALSLASNYNLATRPAVILVKEGRASLIQRREAFDDLVDRDSPLPA
jgi:diaminopimelate decarboxylase